MFKITGVRASRHGACPEIENSPHFRSGWERNVYRFLLKFKWKLVRYESQRFEFKEPYRRALDYLPDFLAIDPKGPREMHYLISGQEGLTIASGKDWIVEIKGRLDGASKSRLLGFKKHHPDLESHLLVITRVSENGNWFSKHLPKATVWDYDNLKRQVGRICGWE